MNEGILNILNYKLRKLLSNEKYQTITDEDRKFILAQAKAKILSYCHRTDIPEDAYYIWADMAICEYKLLDPSLFADVIDSDLAKKLNMIQVGDTKVQVSASSSNNEGNNANGFDNNGQDMYLDMFRGQLQSFRKVSDGSGRGGRYGV
jgi:hypothetical protein